MSIDVANETDVEVDLEELRECAGWVLQEMRVHPEAELAITVIDEDAMEVLHVKWMDLPGPTDVMSFPMDELRPGRDGIDPEEGILGDLVLCPTVAAKQAEEAGHTPAEEMLLLTVHGILHLLGFDHAEPDERKEMFDLQRTLLLTFLARRPAATSITPPSGD
ncbi:putative rRNA maturation factor [Yimella lutea]|uniref:Endoribonuclease YbeY n=1 Tax=Yimella lutea TaxID=587872 RepID=A0A542EIS1_9MICO|nr:rRNA maturation RNase YbeY [Yimella lutea]TQJ15184.1 putative rRNA maturation factor [Yimella lutea]